MHTKENEVPAWCFCQLTEQEKQHRDVNIPGNNFLWSEEFTP